MEQLDLIFINPPDIDYSKVVHANPVMAPTNYLECEVTYRGRPCYRLRSTEARSAMERSESEITYVNVCGTAYVVEPEGA